MLGKCRYMHAGVCALALGFTFGNELWEGGDDHISVAYFLKSGL